MQANGKVFFGVIAALGCLLLSTSAQANGGKVQGYQVDICKPAEVEMEGLEYLADPELDRNFCNGSAAEVYKKFTTKNINFAKKYVLVRMYRTSFVAVDPVKKQVFVLPYAIENVMDYKKPGKITFNANKSSVCTYDDSTNLNPYSKAYVSGDSSNPEYRLCVDFTPGKGFDNTFYPVNIKTGKVVSVL